MTPMQASGMSRRLDAMRGPMSAQLDPPAVGKVGRFAWFVAGAAFGITFAFFATGYFAGSAAPKDEFPAAPTLTAPATAVAPPAQVAAQVAAPVAPPVLAPPPVAPPVAAVPAVAPMPTVPAASLPAAPPVAAVALAAVAPPGAAPLAPAARPAPPPARPRFQAPPPRRPAPPVSQAPKNLGGGGAGADDERAPAPSAPSGDIGDLLGAGLKP